MTELVQKASHAACIVFYALEVGSDAVIMTDSAGNKRYLAMYLDDGSVYWQRCKNLEGNYAH